MEKAVSDPKAQEVLESVGSWANQHPEAAKNLVDIIDIVGAVVGTKIGTSAVSKGVDITKRATEVAGATAIAGAKAAGEVVSPIIGGLTRIPSRIGTNVAARQAFEQEIKTLPTKVAQTAARDGIDVSDIKFVYTLPKEGKSEFSALAKTAKEFEKNPRGTDPIEIVGKPIVSRLKELDSERSVIGKQLGEVADNLGVVTKPELTNGVFNRLTSIPGLSGLTTKDGLLNFSKTTIASSLSKADRKAIQEAFTQATKWGDGKRAHLFRQELFEVLGGKKKSLQQMTDTQDKAFQAIRQGLSDVLESKNTSYKELSNQYRKIVQPLEEMRRFMKTIPEATEDVLDMQAGLLARRLTSHAVSNPKVRAILRAMDEATITKGKSQVSVENLQDFYNILNKYYDIAGKTSFQGQTKLGIEKAQGVGELVIGKARELAGETPAVRQKAFEDMLEELFSVSLQP